MPCLRAGSRMPGARAPELCTLCSGGRLARCCGAKAPLSAAPQSLRSAAACINHILSGRAAHCLPHEAQNPSRLFTGAWRHFRTRGRTGCVGAARRRFWAAAAWRETACGIFRLPYSSPIFLCGRTWRSALYPDGRLNALRGKEQKAALHSGRHPAPSVSWNILHTTTPLIPYPPPIPPLLPTQRGNGFWWAALWVGHSTLTMLRTTATPTRLTRTLALRLRLPSAAAQSTWRNAWRRDACHLCPAALPGNNVHPRACLRTFSSLRWRAQRVVSSGGAGRSSS